MTNETQSPDELAAVEPSQSKTGVGDGGVDIASGDADSQSELEDDSEHSDRAEQAAAELSEEERIARVEMLKPIIEGAVMAAGEAVKLPRLQNLFDEAEMPSKGILIDVLESIQEDCKGRGFELIEVASGWRFQVRDDYASWVNRLWEEKPQKYSRALLETLALVAYRQPLTRGDIEEVRGVAVSSHIIKTLTERDWVKVVGHRDVPGRPALYATTKTFLDYFNLKSLDELPTLGELRDIESLNASLELDEQAPPELIAEMKAEETAAETEGAENESEASDVGSSGESTGGADTLVPANQSIDSENRDTSSVEDTFTPIDQGLDESVDHASTTVNADDVVVAEEAENHSSNDSETRNDADDETELHLDNEEGKPHV